MPTGKTLIDKIWEAHKVTELDGGVDLLHVDRIVLHERSGGRMIDGVLQAGREVYSPDDVFATIDHIVDTAPGRSDSTKFPGGKEFIGFLRDNAAATGVEVFDIDDPRQGIVHVMAPELAVAQPGLTIVCGDSHTGTLGGIGALAWGIGVTQGEHALSTHCLPMKPPKHVLINFNGKKWPNVFAKDIILYLSAREGGTVGKSEAIEFAGSAVEAMSPEERMTLCNMAVEFGGWTGIVAPDDKVFEYIKGKEFAPKGKAWDIAVDYWRTLKSDDDAQFHRIIDIDVGSITPQVTWGTSSVHVAGIDAAVPDPMLESDQTKQSTMLRALDYMELEPGMPLAGIPIEAAFIGSCTNARLEDLRVAAQVLKGRRVAPGIKALCVPGSSTVKRLAEAEGLDSVFKSAGFEWREAGCSLCFYAGGESFGGPVRVISTTNRNFENRQGPGVKTHLASPATVAASAVTGVITDPGNLSANNP